VDDVLLDHLLTFSSLLVLNAMSHTSLVAHEGGDVARVGSVIAGE